MTFAKIALINYSKNKNSKISFCIPKILNPDEQKDIVLQAKNICYPIINNNIIKNSISLDKNNRNMLIVSPVAGGKTVFLSTLLSSLYLANLGIVPGEEFTYTYFSAIIDHLEHRYNIGSGLSQHLAERQSMQELKHLTQVDNRKKIVIIDEIYKGTIPTLAVQEALLDLPPILLKDNIVTIITTHFPEITKIVENTDYALKLYYLKVNHFSGIFEKTFKLYLDDQDNWWIRDFSLALKYQLSQKK